MIHNKGNIRFLNNDTVLLLLIVVAGLLIFSTSFNRSVKTITNTTVAVSLNQKSGDIAPEIRLNVIQKTWVSNKDKFKLLSLNGEAAFLNNKSDQYISLSKNLRKETVFIPGLIFHYHVFPDEKGDYPNLS